MGTRSGDVRYKRSKHSAALCFTLSMVSLKDRHQRLSRRQPAPHAAPANRARPRASPRRAQRNRGTRRLHPLRVLKPAPSPARGLGVDRARRARRLSAPKTCLGPHHDPQQSPARKLSSPEMSVLVFFPTAAQDLGCARRSRLNYCSSLPGFQRTFAYNSLSNTQSEQTASEQRPPQSPRG